MKKDDKIQQHLLIFAWRIKELRNLNDFSAKYVADKIGITEEEYLSVEEGNPLIDALQAFALCELYDVTPNYLLGFSNDPVSLHNLQKNGGGESRN